MLLAKWGVVGTPVIAPLSHTMYLVSSMVSSHLYTGPLTILVSETVQAFASAPGLRAGALVAATYGISPLYSIAYLQGFTDAEGPVQFNGSADLDDVRLQLTNGGLFEAGSAFYVTPVNIQSFTTEFTFQQSNPVADGLTFTIQGNGPTALGDYGAGLGYVGIPNSVALKFDLYNNSGEGPDSTGLYLNGSTPTVPAINLTGTGINLHSGDQIDAHITYDGVTLTLTLTDVISLAVWSHAFAVNIPAAVGANTAYVGFTGGSGSNSSSQKVTYWTYVAGAPAAPNYPVGLSRKQLWLNGVSLPGTALQLTDGGTNETASAYFTTPVSVESFTTDFDFQLTQAVADGFTFVLQNQGLSSVGSAGGGLGYAGLAQSVAVKFDIHNNSGEGTDSTGVYINGASPTVPSIDLTSSGLQLSSGDVIHAHIAYDGKTLTWTLSDHTNSTSSTQDVVMNIP